MSHNRRSNTRLIQFLILKTIQKMKKLFYVLPMLAVLFFTSCEKEETNEYADETQLTAESPITKLYDFHKDITITSTEGTKALVRIYSNSASDLNEYSSKNLNLMEIRSDETLKQSLIRHQIVDTSLDHAEGDLEEEKGNTFDEDAGNDIGFQVIEVFNPNPDAKYAINFNHPDTNAAKLSWKYYTHYSSPNQAQIAEIARHSVWRRVYYGLKYKAYSGSSWATIQNEWRKISNNQSFSHTKNPCYQFRMRVKTKKNSAYSVTFDY